MCLFFGLIVLSLQVNALEDSVVPEPAPIPEPIPQTPEPIPQTPEPIPQTPEPIPQTPEPATQIPEPAPMIPDPAPNLVPTLDPSPEPEPIPSTPEPAPIFPSTPEPTPIVPAVPSPKNLPNLINILRHVLPADINACLKQKNSEVIVSSPSFPTTTEASTNATVIYNCTDPGLEKQKFEWNLQICLEVMTSINSDNPTIKLNVTSGINNITHGWQALADFQLVPPTVQKPPATVLYIIIGVITAVALIITIVLIVSLNYNKENDGYNPIGADEEKSLADE